MIFKTKTLQKQKRFYHQHSSPTMVTVNYFAASICPLDLKGILRLPGTHREQFGASETCLFAGDCRLNVVHHTNSSLTVIL